MHDDLDVPTGPPSRTTSPARWQEAALWAALALAVAAIFVMTWLAPEPENLGGSGANLELQFQAQYLVGVHALLGTLGEETASSFSAQLVEPARDLASTPGDRLSLVPLTAELRGLDAARQEIDVLLETDDLPADVRLDLELLARLYRGEEPLGDDERVAFAERRGWFARLALSQVEAADAAERRRLVNDSIRVALIMLGVAAAVIGGGMVGLVLLVLAVVLFNRGALRMAYPASVDGVGGSFAASSGAVADVRRRLPFFETVLVFILGMTIVVSMVAAFYMAATGTSSAPLWLNFLILPAVAWPLVRGTSPAEICAAYGWHRGQGMWREIGWGLVGYVAGAPLLILAILISVVLANVVEKTPHHPLMDELAGAGWGQIVTIYLLACVSAPLVEELVFRGAFYHYLRGRFASLTSAFVISVVFAVIHPQGIVGVPPLIALAMILALVREWRGSLVGSIAVHAVHNGLATTVLIVLLT